MSDEVTQATAVFKRAQELVTETADAGGNQYKMLAFALLLSHFESARLETNRIAETLFENNQELVKRTIIPPGELPPPYLLKLMLPHIGEMARKDLVFARAMFVPAEGL